MQCGKSLEKTGKMPGVGRNLKVCFPIQVEFNYYYYIGQIIET